MTFQVATETQALLAHTAITQRALASLDEPVAINKDCAKIRTARTGIDLVADDVDAQLNIVMCL